MNVSSLSSGAAAYASGQNLVADSSQETELAAIVPNHADCVDILDFSTEAIQAADELEATAPVEETSDEINRCHLTALWEDEASVANYLQLGFSLISDEDMFYAKMFEVTIDSAEKQLDMRIGTLLEEAGIELDEDQRFDIHVDADGQIQVTLQNVDTEDAEAVEEAEEMAQAIADVLNDDETLGHEMLRVKVLKNTRNSILGFEKNEAESYLLGHDVYGTSMVPELATREFLVDDYLRRELDISLDNYELDETGNLTLIGIEDPELEASLELSEAVAEEVKIVLENDDPTDDDKKGLSADFSFGANGLLDTEETSDEAIQKNLDFIYTGGGLADHPRPDADSLDRALMAYNETASDERKISNFSIVVDPDGRITIEGQFTSGDYLRSNTKAMIESWMTPTLKALTEVTTDTILKRHQAEHGDVDEYPHEVELQVDLVKGITAEVRSEEADIAALADIEKTTIELAGSLTTYIEETFRENHDEMSENELQTLFSEDVEIHVDEDGLLSLGATTCENQEYLSEIQSTLAMLNECLSPDEETKPEGCSATDRLPNDLRPTLDLLQQNRQDMGRIHDRSLCWASLTI